MVSRRLDFAWSWRKIISVTTSSWISKNINNFGKTGGIGNFGQKLTILTKTVLDRAWILRFQEYWGDLPLFSFHCRPSIYTEGKAQCRNNEKITAGLESINEKIHENVLNFKFYVKRKLWTSSFISIF